jgi:hypothetical protein
MAVCWKYGWLWGVAYYLSPASKNNCSLYFRSCGPARRGGCEIHDAAELVLVIDAERGICELVCLSLESIDFDILSGLAAERGRG